MHTLAHHRFLDTTGGLEAVREANERLSRTLDAVRQDVGEARQITEDFGSAWLRQSGTPRPTR